MLCQFDFEIQPATLRELEKTFSFPTTLKQLPVKGDGSNGCSSLKDISFIHIFITILK